MKLIAGLDPLERFWREVGIDAGHDARIDRPLRSRCEPLIKRQIARRMAAFEDGRVGKASGIRRCDYRGRQTLAKFGGPARTHGW